MNIKGKRITAFAAAVLLTLGALLAQPAAAFAADGSIDQTKDHSAEAGMYKYTLELRVDDPCCSGSKDDVEEFWFDFDYLSDNGYGAKKTYRFDMSWNSKAKKNYNDDILRKHFWRSNENGYNTKLDVWVPGLVTEMRVHLNMDWEEMDVAVGGVWLGGYRVNTDTDYVVSRIASSNATIPCYAAKALVTERPEDAPSAAALHDQYGGIFTEVNKAKVLDGLAKDDHSMFYHYDG